MTHFPFRMLALSITLAALAYSDLAYAQTASVTSLTCSSTRRLQTAINAVPAGTVGTINVTGTCNENIVVPKGKTVNIRGATATSRITAANPALPALISQGDTSIQRMIVTNATGAAEALVMTDKEGFLEITTSDLAAPNVESVVSISYGSGRIINSRIIGGTFTAAEGWGSSTLMIKAEPRFGSGPTGRPEVYIRSSGNAVNCAQGASVNIRALSTGTNAGVVTIERSGTGIAGNNCDMTVSNRTGIMGNLTISENNVGVVLTRSRANFDNVIVRNNTENGISLGQSDFALQSAEVTGNGSSGLQAGQSRVDIGAVLFSNTTGDVAGGAGSTIYIYGWGGQSSFPKALTWDGSFNCWSGGRIDIEQGALVQTLGTHYDFRGCVYQN